MFFVISYKGFNRIPSITEKILQIEIDYNLSSILGDEECQENVYHFDGFATKVKNCFHFVKLQLTYAQADQFCQEKLNETIASVDAAQRRKLDPIFWNVLGSRDQVTVAVGFNMKMIR